MRWCEIEILSETSTAGSTSSGAISNVVGTNSSKGSIGIGFDTKGDFGIYNKKKQRLDKTDIVKRIPDV